MRAVFLSSALLIVFLMGWVASNLVMNYGALANVERPFSFRYLFSADSPDVQSPSDHLAEKDIAVYDDRVVLRMNGADWAKYADTNSMDPVLDSDANGIELKPKNEADIHVGDIISYHSNGGLIVHRVIGTGTDAKGWYAITRGDNNAATDPVKVRFSDINGVLVAVIY